MKKSVKKSLTAIVATSAILGLAACSNNSSTNSSSAGSTGSTAGKNITIGLSFPAADHGWMAAVIQNAKDEAKAKGYKVNATTAADPNTQTSDIETLINKKVNVIVMDPIDTNALTPAVAQAKSANIPVVLFDRGVANNNYDEIVTGDNNEIGVKAAEYLGKQLTGKGNIVIISGVPGDVTNARTNGFTETLKKQYPNIKVAANQTGKFTEQDAYTTMQNILQANPHIDAVYSEDDEMSLGALKAIQEAKRTDIKFVTGTGGDKNFYGAIKDNTYKGISLVTFTYSPLMVKQAVDEAISIAKGSKPAKQNNVIVPTQVDSSNVSKYFDANANY